MLTLLLGEDWTANRRQILEMITLDVSNEKPGRILMVPELISHETERRLCSAAGDTTSRFAEVLSFSRLARRVADATGHGLEPCLDDGGRVVAMAAATRQLHSRLKAYASVETKPEFLTGLVDAVDEFKRCCITSHDLAIAASQAEGTLAQKLEELSLILEAYDSLCQQGKRDPRDQMTWLLEQLETSNFAEQHVFYIDGFPDFTRQHMAILEHLIIHSSHVVVSMNCDRSDTRNLAFEKAGETTGQLLRFAERHAVPVEILTVAPSLSPMQAVCKKLFQGELQPLQLGDSLLAYQTNTIYEECLSAAQRILQLVRKGARYRDISVVCADMEAYRNTLSMVFNRHKIPTYLSGTEDILDKSVIYTVLSAVDAALGDFEQQDVLRYLKSVLSPMEQDLCDRIENYAITWSVQGNLWNKEWTNHPDGLGEPWTDRAEQLLANLNSARKAALEPLLRLRNEFHNAKTLKQQVQALYQFLEEIQLSERLSLLADEMESDGDNRNAQILNQLWEILLLALEQLYDILGETVWNAETFTRLLKLLLSQYTVGTIPTVLDSVMVGPVSAMRCQQEKHLLVLGALEGNLPGYAGSSGVLTDKERTALRQLGVPLTGGAMDGLQAEFSEIYGVFCGAEETVCISCPAGQPSFLYRRLSSMTDSGNIIDFIPCAAQADGMEAAALFARYQEENIANSLDLSAIYEDVKVRSNHQIGSLSRETVKKLYGTQLKLSASQVDKLADCRMSYYLKYGLKAKERKAVTVDPAEFGTYVHAVLEETAKEVMSLGGFKCVSLDKIQEIAERHSSHYADDRFGQLDSQRLEYLFRRNGQELSMIVEELWNELQNSAFVPCGFEVSFGDEAQMQAISVNGNSMNAQLRGFVDRVDVWQEKGRNYFRVVDYKTGRKDFDYCDVFNGLGLQMLLYLFALEEQGSSMLGDNAVPAGVQYFPARVPLLSADGRLTEEEAEAAREKMWKRKGLLLRDEDVLAAMEPGDKPVRLSYTRKKDGSISGDLADREQFSLLKAYVFQHLKKMVDEIAEGELQPNPYTRGTSHNACAFCPYGSICHPETVEGRRNYKAMAAQRFWEEVEKELKKNGR